MAESAKGNRSVEEVDDPPLQYMAERAKGNRSVEEVDDPPLQYMFPKGKNVKRIVGEFNKSDGPELANLNAVLAAKARAKRAMLRHKIKWGDIHEDSNIPAVNYDENVDLELDGIPLEPFNLKQECKEGYFDENGCYIKFAKNEIKDLWMESQENVVVDPSYAKKIKKATSNEEEYHDLSTVDIGEIRRSIANILQTGETITQALKRLKGTGGDRKGKMPEGTKRMFDELVEGAMILMENGEYNVYNMKKEIFTQNQVDMFSDDEDVAVRFSLFLVEERSFAERLRDFLEKLPLMSVTKVTLTVKRD